MRKQILLIIALLIMLIDFSSCRMHYESGVSYRPWTNGGRSHRHWGRERKLNNRHRYWGHHRSGMRPHRSRGHFRQYQ